VRILLDSSVLIAAIARPGACTELVEEVARDHTLIFSQYILDQVERKLREKFRLSRAEASTLVSGVRQQGQIVEPPPIHGDACRDPEDLPILGTAVGGAAALLVTVDKDLLSLGQFRGMPIIKPGGFWKRALSPNPNDE
jgi:putative PIN family toxin of toxin-antitoxin system